MHKRLKLTNILNVNFSSLRYLVVWGMPLTTDVVFVAKYRFILSNQISIQITLFAQGVCVRDCYFTILF